MKARYYLLTILVGITFNAFTQDSEELKRQSCVQVTTPSVAALNKFVEFPVNHFNGQVDVSFPLYEIKLKNISIPITLKYHTGGIRVSEEASWVGLGWALDAGGVISHQIRGKDDLAGGSGKLNGAYFPYSTVADNEVYYDGGTYGRTLPNGEAYNRNGQLVDISGVFASAPSKFDGEPDLYIYNMGYYSGKFINWNGSSIDLSCNNIVFTHKEEFDIRKDSITAIDPNGNIYVFKDVEQSFTISGTACAEDDNQRMNSSAYYLSSIQSPNGEKIEFNYKTFRRLMLDNSWQGQFPSWGQNMGTALGDIPEFYPMLPVLSENYLRSNSGGSSFGNTSSISPSRRLAYTFSTMLYLEKIEFPHGSIEFVKSPREDCYGLKLERIYVKNSTGQKIKSFTFSYTYSEASPPGIGQHIMNAKRTDGRDSENSLTWWRLIPVTYPENYMKKRLVLTSFSEIDNENGSKAEKTDFTYIENVKLPYKTSFAQDFWGYYNGQPNTTLLPKQSLYPGPIPAVFGQGAAANEASANRDANPSMMTAGSLKEIIQPTSGKTTFEFETNRCTNLPDLSPSSPEREVDVEVRVEDFYKTGGGYVTKEFTLTKETSVSINVTMNYNTIFPNSTSSQCNAGVGKPYEEGMEEARRRNQFYAVIEEYVGWRFQIFNCDYVWNALYVLKNTNNFEFHQTRTLKAGTYRLTACFPDDYCPKPNEPNCGVDNNNVNTGSNHVTLAVTYKEKPAATTPTKRNDPVGGLRIKKLKQTDPVGNTTIEKNYTYENGLLATNPYFIYSYDSPVLCNEFSWTPNRFTPDPNSRVSRTYLTGNSVTPYSYSANGSLVGYKDVTETYSTGEIGCVKYKYEMYPDSRAIGSALPGMPMVTRLINGFLIEKNTYNQKKAHVRRQIFTPEILNAKTHWGFRFNDGAAYDFTCIQSAYANVGYFWDAMAHRKSYATLYFYPIVQGKVVSSQENVTIGEHHFNLGEAEYGNLGNNPHAFNQTSHYEYNAYCQVVSKKIGHNINRPYVTETYKYVPEKAAESGGVYTLMKNRNIISPLIETQTDNGGAITKQVTNYSQPHTNIFTPSNLQSGTGVNTATMETRITFDNYDKLGNPNSINKDNTGSIIYLWSYKGMYPVAEIYNADYTTVNAALNTVGLGSIETLLVNADPDKAKLDNLRNVAALSKAHITTYKYLPLIGIVEATAPNGITTYYKYDSFNRLQSIEDHNGNVIESYKYNYKN